MTRLAYDGTLDGFLTCLDFLFPVSERIRPSACGFPPDAVILHPGCVAEPDLFGETRFLASAPALAGRFRAYAVRAWGAEAFRCVEYAFRSGSADREALLLGFVRTLAAGKDAKDISDRRVLDLRKELGRIAHEVHKMEGFVRFREIEGGGLIAEIEPDNDIVDLLAPHFMRRHPRDPWLIRDVRRGKAVFWDRRMIRLAEDPADGTFPPPAGRGEKSVEGLWKLYFRTIEIRERRNPELQARLVPHRYRRHLPEFEDEGPR